MKKHVLIYSLVAAISVLALTFVVASVSSLQVGVGETTTYTLTLSDSNGAISSSYSSSVKENSSARTTSGQPFSMSYVNCMTSAQEGYKYAQMKKSSGFLYSTYGVKGLLSIAVTFSSGGSGMPSLSFSSSTSFSSSAPIVSGTVYNASGDYFKVAAGSNVIYISTIVLTYSCRANPSIPDSSLSSEPPSSSSSVSSSNPPASSSVPDNKYYSSIDWSKSGASLKTSLSSLILPHKNLGYDGLWTAYESSDVDSNGKILDMYSNYHWSTSGDKCGNYSKEGDCFNREHTIPQSVFSEAAPMVSDLNHVFPTDGKVNGVRSNHPNGNVANATYTSGNGSKLGTGSSLNKGYGGDGV